MLKPLAYEANLGTFSSKVTTSMRSGNHVLLLAPDILAGFNELF